NHNGGDWIYRDDAAAQVGRGHTITGYVQFNSAADGAAYFGFGATNFSGTSTPQSTYSLVVTPGAPLQILENLFFQNIPPSSPTGPGVPHLPIQPTVWYKLGVNWGPTGLIRGRISASTNTLLDTVSPANQADGLGTSGAIAFPATGSEKYWDTISDP